MKESYLFDRTFNSIVFKGRNQLYGAYKLRRVYHRHIIIAAILATAVFSTGLIGPMVSNMIFGKPVKYEKPVYDIQKPIVLEIPVLPKPPKKEEVALPAQPEKVKVATEAYAQTKVVPDNTPEKETVLANQEDLKEVNFGTEKIEGINPAELPVTLPEDLEGIDGGTDEAPENMVHDVVQHMPEFNGGFDALANYLSRNLKYPRQASAAGIEGTVVVTFVVGRNGEIEDVKVLKGLGFGTDEEAIRVVKQMPRWEAGRQNGVPVAVRYTLPIKFALKN